MTKHASLIATEVPVLGTCHTANEIVAVDKHWLAMHVFVLACQKNFELSALLQGTESTDWPGGEVHEYIKKIEKHFKLTITPSNILKLEIKKEQEMDDIDWKRNTNPHTIWKAISIVSHKWKITPPVTEREKKTSMNMFIEINNDNGIKFKKKSEDEEIRIQEGY